MLHKKIKIGFFMASLTSGGAERIMSFVSKNINREKFEVFFVVIGFKKDTVYDMRGVNVIYLNKSRVLTGVPTVFNMLRKHKFDIAITSIRYMNTLLGYLSYFFPKTSFIGREASVISVRNQFDKSSDRKYPYFIYKYSYSGLKQIICQSADMLNDLAIEFPKLKSRFVVINNPITSDFKPKSEKTQISNQIKLITVGSLIPVKGHLRILEGLKYLEEDFEYTIIGKGAQLDAIMKKAHELGIQDKLNHIPFTKNVKDYLSKSHLFLQGSYVEGFPNALLESCAVGTPVVAFEAPGGTAEIVHRQANGLLINSPEELAKAIKTIVTSNDYNPNQVSKSVFEKFDTSIIISQYEKLFTQLAIN